MDYVLFVGIAMISSVVSAVFGLGTALLVIALGSYVLPIKETIALSTILFTAGTLTRTVVYRDYIDWRLTALMTVFSVPFAYLGASALAVGPDRIVENIAGVDDPVVCGDGLFGLAAEDRGRSSRPCPRLCGLWLCLGPVGYRQCHQGDRLRPHGHAERGVLSA